MVRFVWLCGSTGSAKLVELEVRLITLNTDAVHLPADIFSRPGLILEVNQSAQFNDGLGSADPVGDNPLIPLVIRDNPETPEVETNYLRYTGDEHVVLGGTAGDDPVAMTARPKVTTVCSSTCRLRSSMNLA